MDRITREDAFRGEGANCSRLGTDADGNGHIAVAGQEDVCPTDGGEALRTLVRDVEAGEADHLL
ncbi:MULTISPECIES: hypothetical protein [unclassified Streptomyces]|uniref:hypothetical protein n=1 Tax=unclassified Streptomyces TaxID=2593676 RepID=UPI0006AF3037|nr:MULTISPECIES: hypothetical protein [unclassified Streptomyces]KOX18153.1 hypothetical protein ADL06_31350 [Streptomyces sp. NRRL F-6491]KOX37678.1 hypothetical protein ADL08_28900 [Streptomyces sp. NRRL F-6492]